MWPGQLRWALRPQPPGEASWARTVSLGQFWSCCAGVVPPPPAPLPPIAVAGSLPTFSPVMAKGAHILPKVPTLEDGGSRKLSSAQSSAACSAAVCPQQQAAGRHEAVEDPRPACSGGSSCGGLRPQSCTSSGSVAESGSQESTGEAGLSPAHCHQA